MENKQDKSEIAKREEEILKFWQDNKIFEKSLENPPAGGSKGEFVFYDGPPFATGLPHYGSLLSSVIKDVIPRYKTMRGYRVRRRWGWDCHGLPVESLVEKKLELKNKKEIEKIGVGKFNQEARSMVLQYVDDWEKYIDRLGRWVEFKNSYKTMDNSYIESVWWALSEINKKGLLYEGNKVLMYCPHCETPLAKAEIAMDNSYKDVTEEAVTIKFEIRNSKSEINSKLKIPNSKIYLLAWTTTPWTLPGNVALAVGRNIKYKIEEKDGESFIKADENGELMGKDLVGLEYEPLFNVPKIKESEKAYRVYAADFVNTEEGTGIVHTAVMYGEDDFNLGKKEGLPMVALLDAGGKYNENAPEFLQGKYIKKAEKEIIVELESQNLLFAKAPNTHSYPHCYRCGTPLIYNAVSSWFINIQKIKDKLLKLNEKINWVPEHLKHGRFQNIVENAPDWTISRNRYWASPLPIWKNEKTKEVKVLGSIEEIKKYTKKSGNQYFVMRHGQAENNVTHILSSKEDNPHHLTQKGKEDVQKVAEELRKLKIDLIISSPFIRTKETAEILTEAFSFNKNTVVYDKRIGERDFGDLNLHSYEDQIKYHSSFEEAFIKPFPNGENYYDIRRRVGAFIYDLEKNYSEKNILIITHDSPAWLLFSVVLGLDTKGAISLNPKDGDFLKNSEVRKLEFVPLPHNENYELDLHRPYIDEVELEDEEGNKLKRVPEVVDCWVESGGMPFAELHYPFENKDEFKKRFPGDFIAEYIAQTRTWFYYTHVLGVALFDSIAFKNVVTTGNILAKDGSKMSKSKGNYTDPFINFDIFGSDALRFALMNNVVMQAEDANFKDEDLREVNNRVINILWNSYKFYDMYAPKNALFDKKLEIEHILDKWIMSRLSEVIDQSSRYLDEYNTINYCRTIRPFIDDFSTWFLRRSRDRFKSTDIDEAHNAQAHARFVLIQFSKVIAPVMPFLAESIYLKLKFENDPESVHLCDFPEASKVDQEILENMKLVREIVSLALEKRMTAGIKVRQPLQELRVKSLELRGKKEYLELIKDEINVKEIVFDENLKSEVELDIEITEELKKEGKVRELVRAIQELRKNKNLMPSDSIDLLVETDEVGEAFLKEFESEIKKPTNINKIILEKNDGEKFSVNEMKFQVSLLQALSSKL